MSGVYGFACETREEATAALLVYAVWRSRDRKRFRVTPDVWGQIERFVKASAKRAETIPRFLEALKPRLSCATIHPAAMAVGLKGDLPLVSAGGGAYIAVAAAEADRPEQREFLTEVLRDVDPRRVLDLLYRETAWIVLLTRDRLERERPVEARFETILDEVAP